MDLPIITTSEYIIKRAEPSKDGWIVEADFKGNLKTLNILGGPNEVLKALDTLAKKTESSFHHTLEEHPIVVKDDQVKGSNFTIQATGKPNPFLVRLFKENVQN